MVKLAIISEGKTEIEFIQKIQGIKDIKITGIASPAKENEHLYNTDELLDQSEAVYLESLKTPSTETLKSFLRKSTHIFLKEPFISSLSSIRQLGNFQQEAGSIIQIYNPFFFHSDVLRMKDKLETPLLLDVEVTVKDKSELEQELLKTLLFIAGTEKSDFRKLEVFGLQGDKQALINLHFQFVSGSIAQIKLYTQKSNRANCRINIYQKESDPLQLELQTSADLCEKSEQNALKQFAKAIKTQEGNLITLTELLQALGALEEIKEKLKYPNIQI